LPRRDRQQQAAQRFRQRLFKVVVFVVSWCTVEAGLSASWV